MPQAKRASKGKRPSKACIRAGNRGCVPGGVDRWIAGEHAVGVSGGADPGSAVDSALAEYGAGFQVPTLYEEEISDVSLATFHLFDQDDLGNSRVRHRTCRFPWRLRLRTRLRRLQRLRRRSRLRRLQRLRRWQAAEAAASEAAEAAAWAGEAAGAAAAAAWAGAAAAAACRGEVAPSGARLERLAIALTDEKRHVRVDQVRPGQGIFD